MLTWFSNLRPEICNLADFKEKGRLNFDLVTWLTSRRRVGYLADFKEKERLNVGHLATWLTSWRREGSTLTWFSKLRPEICNKTSCIFTHLTCWELPGPPLNCNRHPMAVLNNNCKRREHITHMQFEATGRFGLAPHVNHVNKP
jgi:hypothetical protein